MAHYIKLGHYVGSGKHDGELPGFAVVFRATTIYFGPIPSTATKALGNNVMSQLGCSVQSRCETIDLHY